MKNIQHTLFPATLFYSRVQMIAYSNLLQKLNQTERQQLYYNKCEISR